MTDEKQRVDYWLLLPVLIMMFGSIAVVYSASSTVAAYTFKDPDLFLKQHAIRVILGIICIIGFSKINYKVFQKYGKIIIWVSIGLLLLIFILGVTKIKGASRWINLGVFSFQPSDIAKFALIIYLSALLVKKKDYVHWLYKGYLPLYFYIILVTGLILLQPNLSTAVIIFTTSMILLLMSNVKFKHVIFSVLALTPLIIIFILSKNYIIGRLTSHAEYSSGGESNYQLYQAIIGFGNGGLFGIGPGNSMQREFFLPEAHADFIFSVIGEEYGFIGTMTVIILYSFIAVRGFATSKRINDDYGKYVAIGLTTLITLYAIVNMCVATGLIPTTGVPMPFISYGGTALLINSVAVGILLNISSGRNLKSQNLELNGFQS